VADSDYFADESTATLIRNRKRFTLIEAERALPLVKRIAADVVRTHTQARSLHSQLARKLDRSHRLDIESQLDRVVTTLQSYVDELTDIGVDLKDYQLGLVDFISTHQGREVCLCWKLGEERITHWHELEEGFQARQPVSILQQD
jgi:hypothetical protein